MKPDSTTALQPLASLVQALEIPLSLAKTDSPELQTATKAALAGATVILDYFQRGVEMRSKPGEQTYNLVSDADVESEHAIADCIESTFPDHAILGEEENVGAADAEHLWIIDPLDGTNNFAHRIPHFAISIAYLHRGQPQCGIVVNPIRNDWYWATRGRGAFHNGRALAVDSSGKLASSMIGCGFYYDRGAMMEATLAAVHDFFKQDIHGIRRFGTAALDLCQVADGLFGVYFEYQLHPWDFAAGKLIVEEAGGRVTNCLGDELPIAKTSILATNGPLHSPALAIVKPHAAKLQGI